MDGAVINGDVQGAFSHSETARVLFEDLATKDTEESIKAAAQESLRTKVMTLPELQDLEARIRGVAPPRCESAQIAVVRAEIAEVVANPATSSKTRAKLEKVIRNLDQYAAELAKKPAAMSRALQELRAAVGGIDTASRSLISATDGKRWMSGIANAAAMSAQKAVDAAAADTSARTNALARARENLAEAKTAAQQFDFSTAARLFKAALDKAEEASKARGTFC